MILSSEIVAIEIRLALARVPLARVFEAAVIDRSTWSRWRSDRVSPTLGKWRAVNDAVDRLVVINAPTSPSSDSKAGRDPAASADPIPEISQSPAASRAVGDRAATPLPSGG